MFKVFSSNISKQFWKLIFNSWAWKCCSLLTVQQIIDASSTIWLVMMMKNIVSGESFFFSFSLYLFTLAFTYIPGCFSRISCIHWQQEAQRSFVNNFVDVNRNQIGEWNNKAIKEEKLSVLTSEGPQAINAWITYVYDLYSYVISVFFNIMALSIVVEPLFACAYAFSVLVVIFVIRFKYRIQRKLTQKALTARIDLTQSLLAAWDNVLLGNFYNFKIWQDKTNQRINRCLLKNIEVERFDQILAILISLITSIPSLSVVVYYVYLHRFDVPSLTAFLVTLPILFTILSYTYQTLSLIFRWTMHRSKLFAIYKAIQPIEEPHLAMTKKIKWPKIHLASSTEQLQENEPTQVHTLSSYEDLLTHTAQAGRITLRGENGSGKSTLLMLVKNSFCDRAFFLPTHNQLSFVAETNKYSTGESLRNRLLEILEMVDVDILLLDEWDANLDNDNQTKLSALIDKLAKKKCVIEVRHR